MATGIIGHITLTSAGHVMLYNVHVRLLSITTCTLTNVYAQESPDLSV